MDPTTGDSAPAQPDAKGWIGLLPILVGVVGGVAFQLHSIAVFAAMIFPVAGLILAGVVTVGSAVGVAAVFRARTGQWRPVASALLALFPALVFWLPVLGPVAVGVIVAALATLTMPGRWKLVGAIASVVVAVATLAPIAVELFA